MVDVTWNGVIRWQADPIQWCDLGLLKLAFTFSSIRSSPLRLCAYVLVNVCASSNIQQQIKLANISPLYSLFPILHSFYSLFLSLSDHLDSHLLLYPLVSLFSLLFREKQDTKLIRLDPDCD